MKFVWEINLGTLLHLVILFTVIVIMGYRIKRTVNKRFDSLDVKSDRILNELDK